MKVLVGVDGSSNSFAAVRFAGRLFAPPRDELVLLYAVPETAELEDEGLDESVVGRARSTLSRAVFDEAVSRLPPEWQSQAVRGELPGRGGSASAPLLEAVKAHKADLIVVGFRGTSLFEQFVLGSVSSAIVHTAPVSVLVVKSATPQDVATEQPAGEIHPPFRVLAAYDGPHFGARMATIAQQISWPGDAVGSVMTVVPPMQLMELPDWLQKKTRDPDIAAMADVWRKEFEQSVLAARDELKQFQQTLPACFASSEPIVAEGRPAEKLLETLRRQPYDLVMMGSRGQGPVKQLLIGSTSSRVLAKGPCSVLIVR